ncbi:MAG: serine protease [Marinilabiliales bacterium]|nr:MAG: serine protease [Marinilabiliales bacterium]
MRYFTLLLVLFLSFSGIKVKADEGMWLPIFIERLNYEDMQKMGLNLTAEEIYSINNGSLKDAIVIFGRGCTGEIVSDQGLLMTNHHCGFPSIAALSSVDQNLIKNGYYAETMEQELPSKSNLSARFLLRIEDVTERILSAIPFEATEIERQAIVDSISGEIQAEAVSESYQEANVKSFFYGNEYYLFVYEVYRDVRLVMAPPSSIGNFGGDTDNWMWPRHTGDFSVFRVYTGPDGKPAEYSPDNIPLKPRHYLPISLKPKKEDDFAMILGYPGSTQRYQTSCGIKMAYDYINPAIVKVREKKLAIMDERMAKDEQVKINYASKYATTSNYWKYYIGMNKGIERLNVIQRKKIMEDDFDTWVNNDAIPKKGYYKDALAKTSRSYAKLQDLKLVQIYLSEAFIRGSDVFSFAYSFHNLHEILAREKLSISELDKDLQILTGLAEKNFRMMDIKTEKKLFQCMLEMYYNEVDENYHPRFYKTIEEKFRNDFLVYSDYVFQVSIFTNKDKMDKFLEKPDFKTLDEDPIFNAASQIYALYFEIRKSQEPLNNQLDQGMRKYISGLREMYPEKKFYPDANFTMRLTYGKVLPYTGGDAIEYNFVTTLTGVMEKEDPSNDEFIVPPKLKELYVNKDFGQYAENGDIITCFLTNNDITGGNSGSPVINGDGELMGLAFDANWEAMSGDIVFEPELQRCISVDIRYVLFIIDKFYGGKRLIDEMDLRK